MNNGNEPLQPNADPLAPFTTPIDKPLPQAYEVRKEPSVKKQSTSGNIIKIIALIFTSIASVTFLILFIWMYTQWQDAKTDVDGQIDAAVSKAKYEQATELEAQFNEREKYPFKTFAGPSDFGEVTFEYPKTWSVYIAEDSSTGKDFQAYLHPDHVDVVKDKTIMALRLSIKNELFDKVIKDYNKKVEKGKMTHASMVANGVDVDIFTGELDNKYQGIVCMFKLRDKTVILQTDAMIFESDFNNIINTIRFNA